MIMLTMVNNRLDHIHTIVYFFLNNWKMASNLNDRVNQVNHHIHMIMYFFLNDRKVTSILNDRVDNDKRSFRSCHNDI